MMSLIEGVGDEVVQFFILLLIVLVAFIAWWSTNISERPFVRTVLILERRTARRAPADSQTPPVDVTEPNEPVAAERSQAEGGDKQDTAMGPAAEMTTAERTEAEGGNTQPMGHTGPLPEAAMAQVAQADDRTETAVRACDAIPGPADTVEHPAERADFEPVSDASEEEREMREESCAVPDDSSNILRNRRLAFFQNRRSEEDATLRVQSSNEELRELIASGRGQGEGQETEGGGQGGAEPAAEGHIRIRLKYLNDDQKMVEGRLREQLGDFKKRHFSIELAGRKLVRLIFNGQVLQQDTKTLENYGLFDNCVVHCLVHQPRTPPPSPNLNRTGRPADHRQQESNPPPSWDLGNILFASLSLLLGLAWYGRYQYAQLYTATTTVALVGLTGIFTVTLIGMYMPDMDGVRT